MIGGSVHYLVDKVQIGDSVAYNAGQWSTSGGNSTTQGKLNNYQKGNNKSAGTICIYYDGSVNNGYAHNQTGSGWFVSSVDGHGAEGQVTLTTVGCPFSVYLTTSTTYSVIDKINQNIAKEYTGDIVSSAHVTTDSELYSVFLKCYTLSEDLPFGFYGGNATYRYALVVTDSRQKQAQWYAYNSRPMMYYNTYSNTTNLRLSRIDKYYDISGDHKNYANWWYGGNITPPANQYYYGVLVSVTLKPGVMTGEQPNNYVDGNYGWSVSI